MTEHKEQALKILMSDMEGRVRELMADSHERGAQWESEFESIARGRSLHIEDREGREDMKVNGKKVQCKNIDEVRHGRVSIDNMRPVRANDGQRGYMVGEYDVLAMKHCGKTYLIPASLLQNGDGRLKSRIKPAEYEMFVDYWSVFDNGYVPPPPPLFSK